MPQYSEFDREGEQGKSDRSTEQRIRTICRKDASGARFIYLITN